FLAEYWGIPISEVVAFGDSPNDIEMLSAAGFSVAMGNAVEVVKKTADFVTKTNDDLGITYALEHIKNI
ncbi:MAG: HAD hydrolase family protein, partial [Oscillospiraceae bacterium]|nr:HAD hydrolase family protein [Oscillospiraceae bacterium]